jgi:hypothetical protein
MGSWGWFFSGKGRMDGTWLGEFGDVGFCVVGMEEFLLGRDDTVRRQKFEYRLSRTYSARVYSNF